MDEDGMGEDLATAELADDGEVSRATEQAALADVLAVLQLCASGKLRCSEKTRRPAAATVVTIAEVLATGDFYPDLPIAAYAWPLLVQAGGLAELAGGRLVLSTRGRAALIKPPAQTIRHCGSGGSATG